MLHALTADTASCTHLQLLLTGEQSKAAEGPQGEPDAQNLNDGASVAQQAGQEGQIFPKPSPSSHTPTQHTTASGRAGQRAISKTGHTNRGRVKQKSHKSAELVTVGTLRCVGTRQEAA